MLEWSASSMTTMSSALSSSGDDWITESRRRLWARTSCWAARRALVSCSMTPSLLSIVALGRCLRSEEHTSELQSLMRISYAVFCLNKKNIQHTYLSHPHNKTLETVLEK